MMKKWLIVIGIALSIGIFIIAIVPTIQNSTSSKPKVGLNFEKREGIVKKIPTIEIRKSQIQQGDLLLVNKEHPIQEESIKTDIIKLSSHKELFAGYRLASNDIDLSEAIAKKFAEMVAAAATDGINHFSLNSGFRSFEKQAELYKEMGSDYALPPGYSEHNLGLSLDVGSTKMLMEQAPEGKWVDENSWKYGFILRYPKDKTEITGILYEPWHIRYVGLPHSAIMKEKNFVLEEYISYLKSEKRISANVNGLSYVVSYYPVSDSITIPKPVFGSFEISGNNTDGVIVTEWIK